MWTSILESIPCSVRCPVFGVHYSMWWTHKVGQFLSPREGGLLGQLSESELSSELELNGRQIIKCRMDTLMIVHCFDEIAYLLLRFNKITVFG